MTAKTKDKKKQFEDALEVARWQGEVSGKIDGALNVLFALELIGFEYVEKGRGHWFDKIIWIPEDPAELLF